MKDIILINGYRVGRPVLPTGIGYIAQAIENAGFDYEVCDANLLTHDQIVQMVYEHNPRFVGCGTMTYGVELNYELLKAIRDVLPKVIIILGGPHAIAAENIIFQECSVIDIIVRGEGEESIVALLCGAPYQSIPGIITRDSLDISIPHKLLDIDSIAFPRFNRFDLTKYGNTMDIASSRGCVYSCSFCGAPKFLGKIWRAFKLDRMIEEFEYWYARGYRRFYFSDSLFALDKKRVSDFCAYIVENSYNDVVFTADGVRADHLTSELLRNMKDANFKSLTFGVESVNDASLCFFNKGETFSQIDNTISIADSLGFDISIYLIVGAPEETYDDAMKSIVYPMKYKNITSSTVSKLMPIMGTSYYEYAIEHKLELDESVYYPKMEAYGTNERQQSLKSIDVIWDKLYPRIVYMHKFLDIRNKIKSRLDLYGFSNIDVSTLNLLTRMMLNQLIFALVSAAFRIAGLLNVIVAKTLNRKPELRQNQTNGID